MANYIDREAMLEQIARREPLMVGDKMISIDALRSTLHIKEKFAGFDDFYPINDCNAELPRLIGSAVLIPRRLKIYGYELHLLVL